MAKKTSKDYARERREKGLCCSCSAPALPGKVRCQKHTDIVNARYRNGTVKPLPSPVEAPARLSDYEDYKLAGICVACKDKPCNSISVYCDNCLEKQRARQRASAILRADTRARHDAEMAASRKAEGRCVDCGNQSVHENNRCRDCQSSWLQRENGLARYDARMLVGLCQNCPAFVVPGTVRCSACMQMKRNQLQVKRKNNICINCDKPTDGKRKKCIACRGAVKADYWARKNAGMCVSPSCKNQRGETAQCEICRSKSNARSAKKHAKLRIEVLAAYGGKCACPGCPETMHEFLSIDHIDGKGAEQRKSLSGKNENIGNDFYRRLKANNFPKENFQLLCSNCNSAKHRFGVCPHVTAAAKAAAAIKPGPA